MEVKLAAKFLEQMTTTTTASSNSDFGGEREKNVKGKTRAVN